MKSWPMLLAVMLMVLTTRVADNEASLIETQAEDQNDSNIKHIFKRESVPLKDKIKKKAKRGMFGAAIVGGLIADSLLSDVDDDFYIEDYL